MGTVTLQNFVKRLAPSMSAASYRLVGTPCNPARKINMLGPPAMPQMVMTMMAGLDHLGLNIHSGPGMPNEPRAALTRPNSGFSNHNQRTLPATTGTMEGR